MNKRLVVAAVAVLLMAFAGMQLFSSDGPLEEPVISLLAERPVYSEALVRVLDEDRKVWDAFNWRDKSRAVSELQALGVTVAYDDIDRVYTAGAHLIAQVARKERTRQELIEALRAAKPRLP